MPFAPGNDPFVITVGAVDLEGSTNVRKHDIAYWSAYGYTKDGFRKPEIAAAGRYMIGPVPVSATLPAERPDHVVSPGYMRLSGTSFAAPIVAGAAAQILARHPYVDAGSGEGCAHAEGALHPGRAAGLGRRRRAQRAALSGREHATEPEPRAQPVRHLGYPSGVSGARVFDSVSWSDLAKSSDVLGLGLLERCLLVGRLLERCLLVGRLLERRFLVRRFVERRARSLGCHQGRRCRRATTPLRATTTC